MSIIDRVRHSNSFLALTIVAATLVGPAFARAQVKILPLGDSITKGVDGSTDQAGYRNDLADSLTSEGVNFTYVGGETADAGGNHEGHDGFRADQVLANINGYLTTHSPDVILLNIGTNDISDNQTTQSTRDEIASVIDAVVAFDANVKIILSSLTPRNGDATKEQNTAELNTLIYGLYLEKRDAGVQIFYAGLYEVFRANPNFIADYLADNVHPNDDGYTVLAGVFFNGIMNALNNTDLTVNDNFERTHLGDVWNSASDNALLNGDLVNNAVTDGWLYLSIFKAIENPSKVSMKWGGSTDADGLELSGLALMLDSTDPAAASGYAITARTSKKEMRLWEIESGVLTNQVSALDYAPKGNPTVGDVLEVRLSTDGSGHRFEVFVNGQSYGTLADPSFLQGNGELQYSGIMLFGNRANDIAEFSSEGGGDFDPPAQIQDLAVTSSTTTSAGFSWTATGGNGTEGTASSYDMRYSTTDITNDVDFNAATPVPGMPSPAIANSPEIFVVLGLDPGTTYFFALKALDASGNKSLISNVVTVTTDDGELVRDDFNTAPLSGDWVHDGSFLVDNNELSNSSTDPGLWNLAVYTAATNALEVSFTWGTGADAAGIDQGGIAVMLDAPSTTANGYVITRRPTANEMRLWRIVGGVGPTDPIKVTPTLASPTAGSEFRIAISSDGAGNHFTVFIDGEEDVTLTDPAPAFIEPATSGALYSGVMLAGGHNNNIDKFTMLLSPNQLNTVAGDNQTGTVGLPLTDPLTVKLVNGSGEPVEGQDIAFEITGGGGSLSDPSGSVLLEAESATVNGGMVIADDPAASQGQYIEVPDQTGALTGIATMLFSVPISGDYYMWGRAIYPDGASDAFKIQVDGGQEHVWDVGQKDPQSDWTWDAVSSRGSGSRDNPEIDPVVFNLNAGNHLLTIKEGKDGTRLDQVLFTRDETFVPTAIVAVGNQYVATTDANGEAAATWTLGTAVGTNTARASYAGLTEEFIATGNPDAPSVIAKVSGENQNALPGQALASPLVVQLRDQYNNIVSNHETNWSVELGNGTLGSSNPVLTDFNGQAQNTLTLSTDSPNTQVKVTAPGYIGPDVVFSMFAQAGDADKIEKYAADSGDNQTGTASKPLSKPFKVRVTDAVGSPVGGFNVTFTVTAGAGRFGSGSQTTVPTNAQGIASATLTLGPNAGEANTAQASASVDGSPVTFSATAATPQSMENLSPVSQNGTVNSPLDSMSVRIKDALGQPLPGFPVVFSVQAGGGKVNGSTNPVQVNTNVNGIAKAEWRLGPDAGQNNNKLRAAAVFNGEDISGSPLDYTASAQVGQAANLAKISGDDQSGVVQDALAAPFVVQVTDNGGNAVVGWPVDFTVQSGGGHFSGSNSISVTTNSAGLASATLTLGSAAATPSNPFNNAVNVSAANDGPLNGSPVSFKASAVATDASSLALVGGNNQTGQAGTALAQTVRVKVADNQQNGIAGHPVTIQVSKGGGTINGTGNGDTQKTINTDNAGVVAVTWYLGGSLGASSQELTITATDGINNLTNSPMTIGASATTGPVDPNASTVVSDKPQLPADGQSVATITVTLKDKFGNVVPGKAVTITSSGSNNDIEQPGDLTDANGQVQGRIASTRAETKSLSARNISDGINLASSTNVQFNAIAADDIEMRGGNNQTANVGTAIESPLEVAILDDNNNPVPGVDVQFVVVSGGGFIVDGNPLSKAVGETQVVVTSATGSDGVARGSWVLGQSPGTNRVEVRAEGLNGSPITFTATGVVSQPATLQLHSGHSQSNVVAGSTLPQPLRVRVIDTSGKPVTQVPVAFQITQGGGELSESSLLTDYRGIAETELTLGRTVGPNTVEATSSGLSGSPTTFEFQSVVGQPALILSEVGDGGSGQVGTDIPISVKIADVYENPVAGVQTTFRVVQSSATIVSQDNTTGEFGLSVAIVNLPTTVGPVVVQATSDQLPGFFKNFEIHAHAGPGANMADFGGNNQDGTVGRELVYPFAVRVTDVFGNPVDGHQVQWIVTPANGSVLANSSTTSNSSGIAENSLTLADNVGQTEVWAIALGNTIKYRATGVTNKFPLFQPITDRSVTEGNELSFQVTATDDDGDPITYEAQNVPQGASFNSGSGTFSWTPRIDQSGDYEVTFIARDDKGGLDSETTSLTVKNENNAPQIVSFQPADLVLALVDEKPIPFHINITDLDNDPLSYSWRANGTLVSTSSQYEFRPSEFASGTYIITIDVTDGEDTASMEWRLDAVTSVELASFSVTAAGFEGVQVSWITAREVDNVGFNVLRSENPNGGFEQLNEELIAGDPRGEYVFVDRSTASGARYYYMLEDVSLSGVRTQHGPISVEITAPKTFSLSQNFPNPFNPETKIRYELPENREIMVKVFDVLGREVRTLVNERTDAGFHEVTWDARDNVGRRVSSGVYYYQIVAGDFREIKKMLLIK